MRNLFYIAGLIVSFFALISCSGTKCLKQGQVLYIGSTMIVKKKDSTKPPIMKYSGMKLAGAYYTVWDLPNGSVFGIPSLRFIPSRLILYNWFYNNKQKGFSYWLRNNLGEEPTLLEDIQPDLKTQKLVEKFESYGHFGTTSTFHLRYNKKGNKAFVKYTVNVADAYTYRHVDFILNPDQDKLENSFSQRRKNTILRQGLEFNLDSIKYERVALFKQLRNDGFCYIQESDIIVEADTSVGNKQVDLRIRVNFELSENERSIVKIEEFKINIDSVTQIRVNDNYYRYPAGKLKKSFLDSIIFIKEGNIYSLRSATQSVDLLSSLGVFKTNYISYQPSPGDSTKLVTTLNLSPADATKLSFDIKGSYKTAGYIGPSVGLKLTQLNLFGKAENLFVELDYYYDFPIGVFRERISNSSGVSARSILKAPFTNSSVKLPRTANSLPFQFASINLEYNDRKDYFRIFSWNASYGLGWSSNKFNRHRLDLLNFTFSDLLQTTARFDTLVADNPSLEKSLVNQFIFGSAYTYTYDKRTKEKLPRGLFFQGRIESAGNSLSLINQVFTNDTKGNRQFFNIPFSQFFQVSYDFRYYKKTGRSSLVVFRHIGGFGLPYGNSAQMPYIKQYFIGGTNSLRPLSARSVGPGRYIEFEKGEVNQVGDIKLEMNIEYRFKIGIRLNGAFWSDAGNIWLLKEDPERPLSGIRWGKVIEDSYLTAGAGLRIDLEYLILRVDYGFLLYAPIFIDGSKWIWQNKLPLWGAVIGFGYPF